MCSNGCNSLKAVHMGPVLPLPNNPASRTDLEPPPPSTTTDQQQTGCARLRLARHATAIASSG